MVKSYFNTYSTLAVILGLIVGLGVGYFVTPEKVVTETKYINNTVEVVKTVQIPVEVVKYQSCNLDEDQAEEDAEIFEEETGRKVFDLKSSRECSDFLKNLEDSYWSDKKEVISYVDVEDGCQVYYA